MRTPPDRSQQRFISTERVSAFVLPFSQPPYNFVTTLKRFIFLDKPDKDTEALVEEIVGDTLFDNKLNPSVHTIVRRFIASNNDNFPSPVTNMDLMLRFLCKSVKAECLNLIRREDIGTGEGEAHPVWNIYIFPPTTDSTKLRDWRTFIQKITFATDTNGAGSTYKIFQCTVCRAVDHPGGMCLFPGQRGWNTPPPKVSPTLESLLNPSNGSDNDRNNNTRGRGRGQRGNNRGRHNNPAKGTRNPARA